VRQSSRGVVVEDVAQHQRGPSSHGDAAQRRKVGLHDEVAVALLPAGGLVARHRLHVDVVGEQVVAAVRLVMGASTKYSAWKRLPISRPCMSGKAAMTVSMAPLATRACNSLNVSMPA
jgi:hypothetical protein